MGKWEEGMGRESNDLDLKETRREGQAKLKQSKNHFFSFSNLPVFFSGLWASLAFFLELSHGYMLFFITCFVGSEPQVYTLDLFWWFLFPTFLFVCIFMYHIIFTKLQYCRIRWAFLVGEILSLSKGAQPHLQPYRVGWCPGRVLTTHITFYNLAVISLYFQSQKFSNYLAHSVMTFG